MDYKQAKTMMAIQKEFSKIQEELSNIHIEAETDGIVVTLDGNGNILNIHFESTKIIGNQEKLQNAILQASKKGMQKVKEISTAKMQDILDKSHLHFPKNKKF